MLEGSSLAVDLQKVLLQHLAGLQNSSWGFLTESSA